MQTKLISAFLGLSLVLTACQKKDDPDKNPDPNPVDSSMSSLRISFTNMVGNEQLKLNTDWYLNENGDSFKVDVLKYYVTNFTLTRDDDSVYTEQESYHLIDQANAASQSFVLSKVPVGNYKKMSFLIGVDRDRNTSGAQTGALDPAHGMFWDWVTGYIMAKIEGVSPSSPIAGNRISLHMGGFQGEHSVVRTVTIDFPRPIQVNYGTTSNAHMMADILEWFKTPTTIDFSTMHSVGMAGPAAATIADNYADMFTFIQDLE